MGAETERTLGPYVLLDRLAAGGMAEVFLAKRVGVHGFEKRLAIKRILPNLAQNPDFVKMFIDEARLVAHLDHPNIVQVFDFGEADGTLFLAMEYVDGITANAILKAAVRARTPVPFHVAAGIVLGVLRGLDHAHRATDSDGRPLGLVHRDATPANVFISRAGEVKLGDFGIARADTRDSETRVGEVKGKFSYMSPEQVQGQSLDHRTDIYTAGVTLAELLTARPLFAGGTELDVLLRVRDGDLTPLWQSAHLLDREVLEIMVQAIAMSPDDRFPTAATFAEVLQDRLRRGGERWDAASLAAWCDARGLWSRRALSPPPFRAVAEPQPATVTLGERYRLREPDGAVRGPFTFPELVELLTGGDIDGESPVSVDGGSFHPLRQLTEVTRFVTSPGLSWGPDEIADAAVRGDLSRIGISRLFYRLMSRSETGVLHFWDEKRRKKVYFVEGRPEFVGSTDKSELLGEHLVRSGTCSREDVDRALEALPRFEGHLGDALVGLGIMRSVDLFRAINEQVRERLFEMFRWRKGNFAYARGMRSHESTFSLGLEPFVALWLGILRGHTLAELTFLLGPYLDLRLESTPHPSVSLGKVRIPAGAIAAIEAVGAGTTIRAILANRETPESRLEACAAIYMAIVCELVASGQPPP